MQQTALKKMPADANKGSADQIAVSIPSNGISLHAHLYMPEKPTALVIISHGNGSSRFNPKNNYVAEALSKSNVSALLVDLLTPKEDSLIESWFDIPLLTERLKHTTEWVKQYPGLQNLPVGFLGVGTGAASALTAAADMEDKIKAVVCKAGRTDLAGDKILSLVACPTLLIVGGLDNEVLKLNLHTWQNLKCKKSMLIINGASHLFEEPGKLHFVSELASDWFGKYLVR